MFAAPLIVALAFSQSAVAQVIYTQYNQYEKSDCAGQPTIITSSSYGQCQVPSLSGGSNLGSSTCTNSPGPVYLSTRTSCNNAPVNMTSIVQLFVATYQWTDNAKTELVVGDAQCHLMSSGVGGSVPQYRLVNCNGGRPIYQVCTDAYCRDCRTVNYDGSCTSSAASSSMQVSCINPVTGQSPGAGNTTDADSSAQVISAGLFTIALIAANFA